MAARKVEGFLFLLAKEHKHKEKERRQSADDSPSEAQIRTDDKGGGYAKRGKKGK